MKKVAGPMSASFQVAPGNIATSELYGRHMAEITRQFARVGRAERRFMAGGNSVANA